MTRNVFYSNKELFEISNNGDISLSQYRNDVVALLYSQFDLVKGKGILSPVVSGDVSLQDFDDFGTGKKIVVKGSVEYNSSNFNMFEYGTINIHAKTERTGNRGICEQQLKAIKSFADETKTYAVGIDVKDSSGTQHYDIQFFLTRESTLEEQLQEVKRSIKSALGYIDEETFDFPSPINVRTDGTSLYFYTNYENFTLKITGVFGFLNYVDVRTLFTTTLYPVIKNVPTEPITFFALEDENYFIRLTHKLDGNIWIHFDGEAERYLCPWSLTNYDWLELEISFTEQMVFCFVNGTLTNILSMNGIVRETPTTKLVLTGTNEDPYAFGQISFFSTIQHTKNYEKATQRIPEYTTSIPFVEMHYGYTRTFDDKSITISSEGDLGFSLYSGSRIILGGETYQQSLTKSQFISAFNSCDTNDYSDLVIKVFFSSDGYTDSVLHSLQITVGTEEIDEYSSNPANFEPVFNFIRYSLGYPKVPVELTDEQLHTSLVQAVYQYNMYRNYETKTDVINTSTLTRADDGSFYLPPGIGIGDILTIFFKPRYSWSWYTGDNSLMANMYMQQLFSGYDLSQSAADYYINITTQNDLRNLLGNQSGFSVSNGRLYIYPMFDGLETMDIGIKYRDNISVDEINNNVQVKQLALAYAKIILGNIRSTFGNQIPGGEGMIQLNGSDLIQQGQAERDQLIKDFVSQQPLAGFYWT